MLKGSRLGGAGIISPKQIMKECSPLKAGLAKSAGDHQMSGIYST
jgi:hypothetical protein